MRNRRSISAVLNDFIKEMNRLKALDEDTQRRLTSSLGRPTKGSLTKKQAYLITEHIFFTAYRAYESLIEDVFLLYTMEKKPITGKAPKSFIKPSDFGHAADLVKSSMSFLDWTSADVLIKRAELYLKEGYPVKDVITSNQDVLMDMKRIRNHVAHNSRESNSGFLKVLRKNLATIPVQLPGVGEFLLMIDRRNRPDYYLMTYICHIERIGKLLCG